MKDWIDTLNAIDGIIAHPSASIASHTPLRVGGAVDAWVRCAHKEALQKAMPILRKDSWKTLWPFQDCLFRDGRQKGVLLRLEGEFEHIKQDHDELHLGASALWSQLAPIGMGTELQTWPGSVGGLLEENPREYFRGLNVELEWFSGRTFSRQTITNWKQWKLPDRAVLTSVRIQGSRKRPTSIPLGAGFVFSLPKMNVPADLLQTLSLDTVRLYEWKIAPSDPNRLIHLGKRGFSDVQLLQKALNQRLKQVHNTALEIRLPIYGRKA